MSNTAMPFDAFVGLCLIYILYIYTYMYPVPYSNLIYNDLYVYCCYFQYRDEYCILIVASIIVKVISHHSE